MFQSTTLQGQAGLSQELDSKMAVLQYHKFQALSENVLLRNDSPSPSLLLF